MYQGVVVVDNITNTTPIPTSMRVAISEMLTFFYISLLDYMDIGLSVLLV